MNRQRLVAMGALLTLNGMGGLVFDPIDQGERSQMLSQLPRLAGTRAHTMQSRTFTAR